MAKGIANIQELVRSIALEYPESHEDHPWGQDTYKVRKKVFVFTGGEGSLTISVKLPFSADEVLQLDYASSTGYGLGKSGWVTLDVTPKISIAKADLAEWIDESYRAVAPKTLVKQLPILTAKASIG